MRVADLPIYMFHRLKGTIVSAPNISVNICRDNRPFPACTVDPLTPYQLTSVQVPNRGDEKRFKWQSQLPCSPARVLK